MKHCFVWIFAFAGMPTWGIIIHARSLSDWAVVDEIKCAEMPGKGWQMKNVRRDLPIGGFYRDADDCVAAAVSARKGAVCSLGDDNLWHALRLKTGAPVGLPSKSREACLSSLRMLRQKTPQREAFAGSGTGLICAQAAGGWQMFSAFTGRAVGASLPDQNECLTAMHSAHEGFVCNNTGRQGWHIFSIPLGRRFDSGFGSDRVACFAATAAARSGLVCIDTNQTGWRIVSAASGRWTNGGESGAFNEKSRCFQALRKI